MKLYLKLVKALIQGVEPSDKEKKYNKIFYVVMSIIAVFGIMLPMAFFVGVILYSMTGALMSFDAKENGIELFLHLIAAFSFIFGLNVIFSVFYFSGDIENLLPLPLRPYQIIGSKFTAALISESVMEFIVIIAALAGYIIGGQLPWYSWLIAIVGMLTMPILPLVYCGILCMVVMYFTRFIKNKDTVNKITGLFTFAVIVGIVIMVSRIGFRSDALILAASQSGNGLLGVMNTIFPTVPFLVSGLSGQLTALLLYILVNVAAIAVFLLLAQVIYYPSVVGISQGGHAGRGSVEGTVRKLRQRSVAWSLFRKEMSLLLRTPAYFTNCVMINLMCPVGVYLVYLIQNQTHFMDGFIYGIQSGDEKTVLMFMLGISAVSVLLTAMNCIASSGLTREGKHFAFVKYIPVSYMTQMNVKVLASIVITGIGLLAGVIGMCLWLNTGIKFIIFSCLLSLVSVAFASYFGMYMDSVNPKLIWDDELNALRGNYNVFFNMALAIVLEAVVCTVSYLLYEHTPVGALIIIIALFTVLLMMTAVSYMLCRYKGSRNIDERVV